MDLVAGVREAVEYQPGITDVSHSAAEAFELGLGVCQDQAHVFVACCRAAGHSGALRQRLLLHRHDRRGRQPRLGGCLARRRRGLAQPRRHARRGGRVRALPPRGRSRLPRRRPGARRAPRRRPRRTQRRRASWPQMARPDACTRPAAISNSESLPPGSRFAAAARRAYHSYPHRAPGSLHDVLRGDAAGCGPGVPLGLPHQCRASTRSTRSARPPSSSARATG